MATLQKFLVKRAFPEYPENARLNHIQGDVVVEFTVAKDGKVIATEAVSGPEMLRNAATSCVRQWKFEPFLVAGEPADVESTAKIMFVLGSM
jgi:protein TonB